MDMTQLTSLFGWMLVINMAVYTLAAGFIIFARDFTTRLEARVTGADGCLASPPSAGRLHDWR